MVTTTASNGRVFMITPNIPNFYFNHENAASYVGVNLTKQGGKERTTFVYTTPTDPQSCSGTVVGLQYCYQARDDDIGRNRSIFEFLRLSRNELQFTINARIIVRATPKGNICSVHPTNNGQRICCEETTFAISDQFIFHPLITRLV